MHPFVRPFVVSVLAPIFCCCVGCTSDDDPATLPCVVPVGESPERGPSDALVTIVEFADFQCYYCGVAESIVREVDAERPGLRWVFKHFPITSIHSHALPAAIAAECAKEQGQFWQMHDLLFANQSALVESALVSYAEELGLDIDAWNTCRASDEAIVPIREDYNLGLAIGVVGTPTFFINGSALPGAYPVSDFTALIDEAESIAKRNGTAAVDYYAELEGRGCNGI